MAQGRYAGALQFYRMGRTKPTHRQGRNRQGHRKIPKKTSDKARKIKQLQSLFTSHELRIRRTCGWDFGLAGAVVLGMIGFESLGFARTDL